MESAKEKTNYEDNISAVTIRSGSKYYKSRASSQTPVTVFQNLNLTVQQGQIYGLLGPSGCGKTTILRCILGQLTLDSGTVLVYGCQPGSEECGVPGPVVGYMPQETSLFDTMTIEEIFWYFGTLGGMTTTDIKAQTKYYIALLRLPSGRRVISQLSGGQARRVSFAATLIHQPKLVVLDEPTVGVDPIVKERIWKQLIHLTTKKNVTVILTTHYIEEAKAANRIGMLHGGTMAHEDETENILQTFNCSSLEEVYMQVCSRPADSIDQEESLTDVDVVATEDDVSKSAKRNPFMMKLRLSTSTKRSLKRPHNLSRRAASLEFRLRWTALKSIILKNLLFILRFAGALFYIFLPPIIVITFKMTYGDFNSLIINVVNEDSGELADKFLDRLRVDLIHKVPVTSVDEAMVNIMDHNIHGMIHIHSNFSELLTKRLSLGLVAGKEVLKGKLLTLSLDPTNIVIKHTITAHVMLKVMEFLDSLKNSTFFSTYPFMFDGNTIFRIDNSNIVSASHSNFTLAVFLSAFASTLFLLFVEIHKGYMERTFVAGVSSAEVIVGMLVVQFAISVLQNIITVTTMYYFYNDVMVGSWFLVLLLYFCVSVSGAMFGVLLSVTSKQIQMILLISTLYLIALPALSGVINTISAAPSIFQYFCKASPLYYPVNAELNILNLGSQITDRGVMLGFVMCFVWSFLFLVLSMKQLMSLKTYK